eukprot:Amastigsp_a511359_54.p7 type:complete len:113 gc:universal Amastigsp_a511359_54:1652-1314(-)
MILGHKVHSRARARKLPKRTCRRGRCPRVRQAHTPAVSANLAPRGQCHGNVALLEFLKWPAVGHCVLRPSQLRVAPRSCGISLGFLRDRDRMPEGPRIVDAICACSRPHPLW